MTFDPSPTCFHGRGRRSKVRQCQLMRWTMTVGICWQQGREDVEWVWLCGGCVAPAHTGNKVSCGVGGVVQWP